VRPFRVPWTWRRVPVLPVLGLLSVLLMLSQLDARALSLGVLLCAVGTVAAVLVDRRTPA
jgi:hypothetical protein